MALNIALIGCGEAGSALAAAGASWHGMAYDLIGERSAALGRYGLARAESTGAAVANAEVVLSLVTAGASLAVAELAARSIKGGAIFCDMNSVAPQTKRRAGKIVEEAGGRYVDAAVMAPVEPAHLAVPLLLSGAAAYDASSTLERLGFQNIRVVGDDIGRASAIKMIRSVMVKGIEALTDEMMAAATTADVVADVLESLDASERARPWKARAEYNLERMTTHGLRRAEEMEQSAATLRDLGIEPVMTEGTVRRQREAADRTAGKQRDGS